MYVSVTTLEEERAELMALKETLQKYEHDLNQTLTESAKAESLMKSRAVNAEGKLKHLETKFLMESGNLNRLESSNKQLNLELSQKSLQLSNTSSRYRFKRYTHIKKQE